MVTSCGLVSCGVADLAAVKRKALCSQEEAQRPGEAINSNQLPG